jgi:hypothetical protein
MSVEPVHDRRPSGHAGIGRQSGRRQVPGQSRAVLDAAGFGLSIMRARASRREPFAPKSFIDPSAGTKILGRRHPLRRHDLLRHETRSSVGAKLRGDTRSLMAGPRVIRIESPGSNPRRFTESKFRRHRAIMSRHRAGAFHQQSILPVGRRPIGCGHLFSARQFVPEWRGPDCAQSGAGMPRKSGPWSRNGTRAGSGTVA